MEKSSAQPANKFDMVKKSVHDFLHEKNYFTYGFEMIEKYAKVKREYVFYGLIGGLILYLMIGYGAGLVVNLLGFVYPAYMSCKAIDSEEKDDDTQWLTYWVVYAAFGICEYFTDIILSWVPFYFLLKCIFLVWCMLPMANNGSILIYNKLIKPFVKKHEKTFEKVIDETTHLVKDAGQSALGAVRDAAGNVTLQDMQKLNEMKEALLSEKPEKQD